MAYRVTISFKAGDKADIQAAIGLITEIDVTELNFNIDEEVVDSKSATKQSRPHGVHAWTHDKRVISRTGASGEVFDCEATAKNLGMTIEQVVSRSWNQQSLEHAVKMAYLLQNRSKKQ